MDRLALSLATIKNLSSDGITYKKRHDFKINTYLANNLQNTENHSIVMNVIIIMLSVTSAKE